MCVCTHAFDDIRRGRRVFESQTAITTSTTMLRKPKTFFFLSGFKRVLLGTTRTYIITVSARGRARDLSTAYLIARPRGRVRILFESKTIHYRRVAMFGLCVRRIRTVRRIPGSIVFPSRFWKPKFDRGPRERGTLSSHIISLTIKTEYNNIVFVQYGFFIFF